MSKKKEKQEQKQKDKMKENKKLHKKKQAPAYVALGVLLVLGSMAVGQATKPYGDGLFGFLQTDDLSVLDDTMIRDTLTVAGSTHLNSPLYYAPQGINCNGYLYIQNDQVMIECWNE